MFLMILENYLAKATITSTPEHGAETLTKVWREANLAQVYLAQLPISSNELSNTSKFLNQVSEYSYSLSRKNIYNEELSQEESAAMTKEMIASMLFQNRRIVWEHLQSGTVVDDVKTKYNNVIPHYLIYTTLGRADLVRFESFMEDCLERGKKLMK